MEWAVCHSSSLDSAVRPLRPEEPDGKLGLVKASRRQFMVGVGGGVVLLAGGLAAVRAKGYSLPPELAGTLRSLASWEYVVLTAFGQRVLAPESAEVGRFADEYFVGLPASDRRDISRFLGYLEHLAPFGTGRGARFSSLSAQAQDQVLLGLAESPVGALRAGFNALKAVAVMALYSEPRSWPAIGYPGPVVVWEPQ